MNKSALIGYTGFIGSNLANQYDFTDFYNSKNIANIIGKEYDMVFSSANSGYKWKVNLNPESDKQNILKYIYTIKSVKIKKFILISSIDIYPDPNNVDESYKIKENTVLPYGQNRLLMEHFVENNYDDFLIVRVPIIYGNGFKKNVIFDLLNNNQIEKINPNSILQIYNSSNLKEHIDVALQNNLKYLNLAVEPIPITEVASKIFNIDISKNISNGDFKYNMKTLHDYLFGSNNGYIQSKEEILNEISSFIKHIKK